MSAVVASYSLGLLKPVVESANEPLPVPILPALHEAFIGNDALPALAAVAWLFSMYLMIDTVTSGSGPLHVPFRSEVVSHNEKSTFALAESPVPCPLPLGPLALPHQLQVESSR